MSTTIAPPQPIETDVHAALPAVELPIHARHLPCARCSRTQAGHAGTPPDCEGFIRPRLPTGHAYVDELRTGDRFRFLAGIGPAPARTALDRPLDLDVSMGLLQLRSSTSLAEGVHLVERNTVVLVPPAWTPVSAVSVPSQLDP